MKAGFDHESSMNSMATLGLQKSLSRQSSLLTSKSIIGGSFLRRKARRDAVQGRELDRLRSQSTTYTEPFDESDSIAKDFTQDFYRGSLMFVLCDQIESILLEYSETVGEHYKNLVPTLVSFDEFWLRYTFRTMPETIERELTKAELNKGQTSLNDMSQNGSCSNIVSFSLDNDFEESFCNDQTCTFDDLNSSQRLQQQNSLSKINEDGIFVTIIDSSTSNQCNQSSSPLFKNLIRRSHSLQCIVTKSKSGTADVDVERTTERRSSLSNLTASFRTQRFLTNNSQDASKSIGKKIDRQRSGSSGNLSLHNVSSMLSHSRPHGLPDLSLLDFKHSRNSEFILAE